jgi:hypothetical protein
MFTETIARLSKKGVLFSEGLLPAEITKIEELYDLRFPQDLASFYQTALPVSRGFYRWNDFSDENVAFIKAVLNIPAADIREVLDEIDWCEDWGEEPSDFVKRCRLIVERLSRAPKLIPIFLHRYMSIDYPEGNPVFSVHGSDIIYYGGNLEEYLDVEFDLKAYQDIAFDQIRKAEFWSDLI